MSVEWNNYIIKNGNIGKGSYSKVYKGYHKVTKLEIAMKKIVFNTLNDNVKDKVISEINILQKMDHLHIIKLYEYKFEGNYIILITEYCKDKDLEVWIHKEKNIDEIKNVIEQIVTGIEYMHNNHILHRDIKSQNILLHDNIIKICDFGFSTMIKENNQMFNTVCGTPLFMSPELLFLKPYTIKSEIWALGILFYMILYKSHPFGKLSSINEYRLKINNPILFEEIEGLNDFIEIVKKMLSLKESERPSITNIKKLLNKEPIEEEEKKEVVEYNRITELEDEVFRLESIIKEKGNNSFSCCFDTEDDHVTGRGRTNKGYENITIDTEYFTPPKGSIPIQTKQRSQSYSFSGSSGKSKDFLSSSIDKIKSFFRSSNSQ